MSFESRQQPPAEQQRAGFGRGVGLHNSIRKNWV